jgi:hypothetical protein
MNKYFSIPAVVFVFASLLPARPVQPAADWNAWRFVLGEWIGEGAGAPGEGTGGFSFLTDLQGRILVRKNHTEFPAAGERPAFGHEDLMIVAQEPEGTKAVYWDNEGHVIRYDVEIAADGSITFTSPIRAGDPRFRLSYRKLGDDRLGIRFETAAPDKPDDFKIYLDGTARKK